MKFWLTLVVSIVAISALMTWMALKGGQSYGAKMPPMGPRPSSAQSNAPPPPPKMVVYFRDESGNRDADVIQIKAGDSPVGEESRYELGFKNFGEGPLEITLEQVNCGCVSEVLVGKSPKELHHLQLKAPPVMFFGPKEAGMILIKWKPEEKQLPPGVKAVDKTFKFVLGTNESMYPTLIMEVNTRIVPGKETKE